MNKKNVSKDSFKNRYIILSVIVLVILSFSFINVSYKNGYAEQKNISKINNCSQFRNLVIKLVKKIAKNHFCNQFTNIPEELKIEGTWNISINIYHEGKLKGYGKGKNKILYLSLKEAVLNALEDERCQNLDEEGIKKSKFLVTIYPPNKEPFSFIEFKQKGLELVGDLVAIRNLDKKLILEKIKEGQKYLFRVIDKNRYGAHKYYYALDNYFEDRLHTIYTSSLIYTLSQLYDYTKDKSLLNYILNCSKFVLSMQNRNKKSKTYGAFHYSLYLNPERKDNKFVVGTTAKTIFTLLKLYKLTDEDKYLISAKLGAEWLLTMQKKDGSIISYKRYRNDKWYHSTKFSLLYNGQVLSALSRIYKVTKDKKYYNGAQKIAKILVQKVENEGCYLGDDYRIKNPISSSWVIMSLLDFYKVNQKEYYKYLIFKCSKDLLERQMNNIDDIFYNGCWENSYSTSGNGWINEVMVEIYKFCKKQNKDDCCKYKNAIIRVTRWLIQNTYSEENTFCLENSQKVIGGIFWNDKHKYVRTDSVCHALNAYIGIINNSDNRLLLSIPEKQLREILN